MKKRKLRTWVKVVLSTLIITLTGITLFNIFMNGLEKDYQKHQIRQQQINELINMTNNK